MDLNSLDVLRRQIKRAEAQLIQARTLGNSGDGDNEIGVLFAGNWHDAIPRRLIADEELTPVEKVTWMTIRTTIDSPQQPGATPRRADLARSINCSPPTVSTSQAMLRIMRWMCQCKPVRHQGRFVGNILLMSDEPLSLATVLELDDTYIEFLEATARNNNRNSRMRKAAAVKLRDIDINQAEVRQPTELQQIAQRASFSFSGYRAFVDGSMEVTPTTTEQPQNWPNTTQNSQPNPRQSKILSPVRRPDTVDQSGENQTYPPMPGLEPTVSGGQSLFPPAKNSDQRKFFATVDAHQRKNFAPVRDTPSVGEQPAQIGENSPQNHQSKNFSTVNLPENHQSKFLSPVNMGGLGGGFVCSSLSTNNNNSYFNNTIKTTTTFKTNPVSTNSRMGRDQQKNTGNGSDVVDWDGYGQLESEQLELAPLAENQAIQTAEAESNCFLDEMIDEDPAMADYEELQDLVARHLPELAQRRLEKYVLYLLGPRKASIPQLARLVRPLDETTRKKVLFQLLSKSASDWGGWSKEPLSNAVGYLKSLVEIERKGSLYLDDFAIRLWRAAEENFEPYIPVTIDREADLRALDRGRMESLNRPTTDDERDT